MTFDPKYKKLTEKEAVIMNMLWQEGPLTVRQMLERYEDPKPHFNTVSTTVRILEEKGYVGHMPEGNAFRYFAAVDIADFRERSLTQLIKSYFNNSYTSVVSSLVAEEKISVDELREIIDMVEKGKKD